MYLLVLSGELKHKVVIEKNINYIIKNLTKIDLVFFIRGQGIDKMVIFCHAEGLTVTRDGTKSERGKEGLRVAWHSRSVDTYNTLISSYFYTTKNKVEEEWKDARE